MPIYDFQCNSCGFKDEVMRKVSEASTGICPSCQKETFSKLLSAPNFQLNGTGWYASDFKDKKSKNKDNTTEKSTEKAEVKTAEKETKVAACNPGCACH